MRSRRDFLVVVVCGKEARSLFVCATSALGSVRKRKDVNCVVDFPLPPELIGRGF